MHKMLIFNNKTLPDAKCNEQRAKEVQRVHVNKLFIFVTFVTGGLWIPNFVTDRMFDF